MSCSTIKLTKWKTQKQHHSSGHFITMGPNKLQNIVTQKIIFSSFTKKKKKRKKNLDFIRTVSLCVAQVAWSWCTQYIILSEEKKKKKNIEEEQSGEIVVEITTEPNFSVFFFIFIVFYLYPRIPHFLIYMCRNYGVGCQYCFSVCSTDAPAGLPCDQFNYLLFYMLLHTSSNRNDPIIDACRYTWTLINRSIIQYDITRVL